MKKSGMTIVFVIVCIGVLVAAYGVGVCVRETQFRRARAETEVAAEGGKPGADRGVQKPIPAPGARAPECTPPPAKGADSGGEPVAPTREQLENISDEERQEAMARMRERFGGRRREGGPQLSDEDRAKMRDEMEKVRERWDQMSDEEKQKVEADIHEKYGFFPSPDGRGGRGSGGGGRRRSMPDDGQ